MENNVLMQPSADITPPTRQRGLSWLNISLIALACIGVAIIAVLVYFKKEEVNKNMNLTQSEVVNLRKAMSESARSLGERAAPGSEFISTMEHHINSAPTSNSSRSLKFYLIYLSIRHNFIEEAAEEILDFKKEEDLSDLERCELAEYSKIIATASEHTDLSLEENELERNKYCPSVLGSDNFIKKTEESDYSYSIFLYYSGIITDAVNLLKAINVNELSAGQRRDVNMLLGDYYVMIGDMDSYSEILERALNEE